MAENPYSVYDPRATAGRIGWDQGYAAAADEIERLRATLSAIKEIAEAPINGFESEAQRLSMIERLVERRG